MLHRHSLQNSESKQSLKPFLPPIAGRFHTAKRQSNPPPALYLLMKTWPAFTFLTMRNWCAPSWGHTPATAPNAVGFARSLGFVFKRPSAFEQHGLCVPCTLLL
jgi:hypothetical protein